MNKADATVFDGFRKRDGMVVPFRRDKIVLATKLFGAMSACRATSRRLSVETLRCGPTRVSAASTRSSREMTGLRPRGGRRFTTERSMVLELLLGGTGARAF